MTLFICQINTRCGAPFFFFFGLRRLHLVWVYSAALVHTLPQINCLKMWRSLSRCVVKRIPSSSSSSSFSSSSSSSSLSLGQTSIFSSQGAPARLFSSDASEKPWRTVVAPVVMRVPELYNDLEPYEVKLQCFQDNQNYRRYEV
jgi:hypothetical protein